MNNSVVVLGASGMLGSMVLDWLSRDASLQIAATVRGDDQLAALRPRFAGVEWRLLDAERCAEEDIVRALDGAAWVVNAIGVIKPYIHDNNAAECERAVVVNALFPHLLARTAERGAHKVLQIATDCVYSGTRGRYTEPSPQDALDVYGKTKSLGEVHSPFVHHLRCSIIGPEPKGHVSLLDWFLGQERGSTVGGYTNHQWNGVTTLHFARLCHGIITHRIDLPHQQHVVPVGMISKCDMLRSFADAYGREDIIITPTEAKTVIDRTLSTIDETRNRELWMAAGYVEPPTVREMVSELARFDYRLN